MLQNKRRSSFVETTILDVNHLVDLTYSRPLNLRRGHKGGACVGRSTTVSRVYELSLAIIRHPRNAYRLPSTTRSRPLHRNADDLRSGSG